MSVQADMPAKWIGPFLTPDQDAVRDLVDQVAATNFAVAVSGRRPALRASRAVLAEHGLWSVGWLEELGGGGADQSGQALVLMRVAAEWPAAAVAAAQVYAVGAVAESAVIPVQTITAIATGERPVAVVDLEDRQAITGGAPFAMQVREARVNAVEPDASDLLVLVDRHRVAYVAHEDVEMVAPMPVCGLDGGPCSVVRFGPLSPVEGLDVDEVRRRLAVGLTAVAAGIAQAAYSATYSYTRERVQFGAPLAALATMQQTLFDQLSATLLAVTAALSEVGTALHASALLDRSVSASLEVTERAVQAHGGYGYLAEYRVEAMFRDAVSLQGVADTGRFRRARGEDIAM